MYIWISENHEEFSKFMIINIIKLIYIEKKKKKYCIFACPKIARKIPYSRRMLNFKLQQGGPRGRVVKSAVS